MMQPSEHLSAVRKKSTGVRNSICKLKNTDTQSNDHEMPLCSHLGCHSLSTCKVISLDGGFSGSRVNPDTGISPGVLASYAAYISLLVRS